MSGSLLHSQSHLLVSMSGLGTNSGLHFICIHVEEAVKELANRLFTHLGMGNRYCMQSYTTKQLIIVCVSFFNTFFLSSYHLIHLTYVI